MEKKSVFMVFFKKGYRDTKEYYHKDKRGWTFNISSSVLVVIIASVVSYYLGDINMPGQLAHSLWVGLLDGGIFLVIWLAGVFVYHWIKAPYSLYKEEKRKADKYNWNDIDVSYEYFEEKAGCKVKIKNDKATDLFFRVEIQYLELDGVREDYVVPGKSRILLWIPNPAHSIDVKDSNWTFGFVVNSGDGVKFWNIGLFELSNVIENAEGIKHRIVSCDWSENETKRPPRKYGYFTKFAKGELKIHGTNLTTSGLSSLNRKYETKSISENLVYKFRIDAKNNQQVMTKFEPGPLELHADSKKEAANEG